MESRSVVSIVTVFHWVLPLSPSTLEFVEAPFTSRPLGVQYSISDTSVVLTEENIGVATPNIVFIWTIEYINLQSDFIALLRSQMNVTLTGAICG